MPNVSRRFFLGSCAASATILGATGRLSASDDKPILGGLIAAVFTPFHKDGSVNVDIVPDYVDRLLRDGMEGFYVTGSTGEGVSLSVEERKTIAEAFVRATKGRVPVTVQIGANSIADCRALAAHAESIGVHSLSANAPSYFTVNDEKTLVDFMATVASAAPKTPFYYYHIPSRAKVHLPDMTRFLALAERRIPNLAGIKYTDSRTGPFQDILRYGDKKFEALWGTDEMLIAGLAAGARGGIGTSYPLAPGVYRRIVASFRKGDMADAQRWQYRSWTMVKALVRTGSTLAACRAVHLKDGLDLGLCRLPLGPLSREAEDGMFRELESIGYYDWRNGPA